MGGVALKDVMGPLASAEAWMSVVHHHHVDIIGRLGSRASDQWVLQLVPAGTFLCSTLPVSSCICTKCRLLQTVLVYLLGRALCSLKGPWNTSQKRCIVYLVLNGTALWILSSKNFSDAFYRSRVIRNQNLALHSCTFPSLAISTLKAGHLCLAPPNEMSLDIIMLFVFHLQCNPWGSCFWSWHTRFAELQMLHNCTFSACFFIVLVQWLHVHMMPNGVWQTALPNPYTRQREKQHFHQSINAADGNPPQRLYPSAKILKDSTAARTCLMIKALHKEGSSCKKSKKTLSQPIFEYYSVSSAACRSARCSLDIHDSTILLCSTSVAGPF